MFVTASSGRSLSALAEVEEPAESKYRLALAPIDTNPFGMHGEMVSCGRGRGPAASAEYLPTGPGVSFLRVTGIFLAL